MSDFLTIFKMEFGGRGNSSLNYSDKEAVFKHEREHVFNSIKNNPFSPFNPKIESENTDSNHLSNNSPKVFRISSPQISPSPPKYDHTPNLYTPPYKISEVIQEGNDFFQDILNDVEDHPYEMSDWEDEEPMKPMELDIYSHDFNGKYIPSWAIGEDLIQAMKQQEPSDGDKIFHSLLRRIDYKTIFGTSNIPYYHRKKI